MYKELHDLWETLCKETADANDKIRNAGGKLTSGDLEYVDKLTHALKSIKTTLAMIEAEDGESGRHYDWHPGQYSYRRGRDAMGRYTSRRGYSYDSGMIDELRGMMDSATDDRMKQELRQFIAKIESM